MFSLTLAATRAALRARKFSARELDANLPVGAIEALNPRLNAFITVTPELALRHADAADAALARGEAGNLTGIPLAIKDLFCTAGVRTTAGSKILEPFVPPYESTVTSNLLRDGAVFLGKTNLDEFAMGSSNMTSAFGPVANPWTRHGSNATLVPGGSSGGSAAAVAARLALGRHRDRHRRLDSPARQFLRHRRHQADLRTVQPLGHRGLRDARWIRPGRSRVPSRIAPSCSLPWPATTRRTAPAPIARCPISPPPASAASRACASACRASIAATACRREIEGALAARPAVAARRRRKNRGRVAAAHQVRARHLLHRRPCRGLVQPGPLRRRALRRPYGRRRPDRNV